MTKAIIAAALTTRLVFAFGFVHTAVAEDKLPAESAPQAIQAIVTAYSSSPDETDDTPSITASGKTVGDGVIASNCLPFGTKVKIPELFGDRTFIVEDRKSSRYGCEWLDVWYPTKAGAQKFGIKRNVEALVY